MNIREWTLPLYTILMQLATGVLLVMWIIRAVSAKKLSNEALDRFSRYPLIVVSITILTAMAGSHFHLSRPLFSIYSILNFHTSWLSREIVFNILFFVSVVTLMILVCLIPGWKRLKTLIGWIAVCLGLATGYCMGRIYLIPTQPAWDTPLTITTFYLTTLLLGVMALPLMLIMDLRFVEMRHLPDQETRRWILGRSLTWLTSLAFLAALAIVAATFVSISLLREGSQAELTSLQLLLGLYEPLLGIRLFATIAGISLMGMTLVLTRRRKKPVDLILLPVYIACLLVIVGEILGRILFYATHVRVGI